MTAARSLPPEVATARFGKVTGSRVAAILGLDPYKSRDDVLREMVRDYHWAEPEFAGNAATEWGREHEPDAIAEYEWRTGVLVHGKGRETQATVIHPEHEWIAITPDGLVGEDGLVEAKCPWRALYSSIEQRGGYYAQVQLQLETTGRKWCDFVIWRPQGTTIERLVRDEAWFPAHYDELQGFVNEFWETARDPERSQPHLEPLTDLRTDEEWNTEAYLYLEALAAKAAAEELIEERKKRLVELSGGKSTRGGGVLLVPTRGRKGAVDYDRLFKERGPELIPLLDSYRKASGKPGVSIRRTGEK